MIDTLALTMGGPLMLLFGIIAAAVLGCAAGFVMGTTMGRTRPATPLPTTLRVTRETLATTTTQLEKASARLNTARRSDLAGSALILGRRIAELSAGLGALERKTKHAKEASE